jgi:lysophospholipase L1-like esterase
MKPILALLAALLIAPLGAHAASSFQRVEASRIEQTGKVPPEAGDAKVLANEPDGGACGVRLEFDLEFVTQRLAPMARLQLGDLEKLKLKRPGHPPGGGRGAVHVFVGDMLTGSTCVKPAGIPTPYTIDVTEAVSRALAKPAGQRKVTLELRMTGLPAFYEAYALRKGPPALEIAPDTNWTDDAEARLRPLWLGTTVYRESCLPLTKDCNAELTLPLLYPATRITEVVVSATGERLQEGRDWSLREGKLVLSPGTRAPVQSEEEFFTAERKEKDGSIRKHKTSVRLVEGTWYHERQIEVSYETAAKDLPMPEPRSSLADLPKLRAKLAAKSPVTLVLFGDSIATGGNASKFQGAWPWQPAFGELVARELERRHGSRVTLMNHSRGGATSDFGTTQTQSQVAWFKPDLAVLAYGMNDRSLERQQRYRANLEKIIATVRATSPDTEFLIVTPMMNNPIPGGHTPILAIRDAALSIQQPGVALADVTSAHQAILTRKPFLDTSGNGSNHPNDFLHRVYAMRILEVLAP